MLFSIQRQARIELEAAFPYFDGRAIFCFNKLGLNLLLDILLCKGSVNGDCEKKYKDGGWFHKLDVAGD